MMRNLLHFPLPGVQPQLAQRLEHHRTEIVRQWRQLTPQVIPLANLARALSSPGAHAEQGHEGVGRSPPLPRDDPGASTCA
jgi:hypothetical protein